MDVVQLCGNKQRRGLKILFLKIQPQVYSTGLPGPAEWCCYKPSAACSEKLSVKGLARPTRPEAKSGTCSRQHERADVGFRRESMEDDLLCIWQRSNGRFCGLPPIGIR